MNLKIYMINILLTLILTLEPEQPNFRLQGRGYEKPSGRISGFRHVLFLSSNERDRRVLFLSSNERDSCLIWDEFQEFRVCYCFGFCDSLCLPALSVYLSVCLSVCVPNGFAFLNVCVSQMHLSSANTPLRLFEDL